MAVYIQIFSGSGTVRITDMTNAGKRGKSCPVVTFSPKNWNDNSATAALSDFLNTTPEQRAARGSSYCLETGPKHDVIDADFDALMVELVALWDTETADSDLSSIRGVDAPAPKLTAGVDGEWSASCDNNFGVSLRRYDINEWTEITHGQHANTAYKMARSAWDRVKAAKTFREASDALHSAGCRLHGYCGMD